ncbi:MAG: 50S ribosomal protein L2 [Candidatus Omnitrophica bacterium]|nr:50S ribosomal protein L2 [Candidatus Omnitrophota bacterium]MCF7893495.1 50S ribosomal protein L2 [Candidatus Omnitrophota bacterium]
MGIKKYKPTSPGLRTRKTSDFSEVTKNKPEKTLTKSLRRSGGRNNQGKITMRRRGGGSKRKYRVVDFKRDKFDKEAEVLAIEYDPNRNARLALVKYPDEEKRYIIWPAKLKVKDKIISASESRTSIKPGNSMKLKYVPMGTLIHNIELNPGRGAVLVRSAGSWAQLMAKEKGMAQIRLASGEVRLVKEQCRATVGQVGLGEYSSFSKGKAGKNRWAGKRPKVRGVAMNPVDHPHGGGEGKAGQGNPHPVSPWGQPAKGGKTRRKKRSDKYIIKKRTKGGRRSRK